MSGLPALKLTLWLPVAAPVSTAVYVAILIARRKSAGGFAVELASLVAGDAFALAITNRTYRSRRWSLASDCCWRCWSRRGVARDLGRRPRADMRRLDLAST
jgi:hypothetical protein